LPARPRKRAPIRRLPVAVGAAEIDPLDHIPVYDDNNAIEVGMAIAAPGGEL